MTPTFIAGPYVAPPIRDGDWIVDEIAGLVEVGGWTSSPLSWPRRKKAGRASLILTSELARAVRAESVEALAYWFGVSPTTVWKWRQLLGVPRVTAGTRKVLMRRTVPAAAAARGRARAAEPEARQKISKAKMGKAMHENTRAALLRAVKEPKPEGWGKRANAWMLQSKKKAID